MLRVYKPNLVIIFHPGPGMICGVLFDIIFHLFDVGFVDEFIQNEKCLKIILKRDAVCHPLRMT